MLAGLQNVTFEFGSRAIVRDATWHIQPNERIGLVGYNGTGKSTLLKLLVGEYLPNKGTLEKSKNLTIGYLHQDLLSFDSNDSILDVALGAFVRVKELEKELEKITHQLETDSSEDLLNTYSELLHEMDVLDGYNIEHKAEQVLQGLGFANENLQKPYKQFSGGWRMRVLLAKMILQAPDLLLLDEPTNHLDLPSIEWLEKYLIHYKGSVVIVSHDKFFLNRMVTKIVEVYQQQLHIYSGDYEFYETEKVLRVDLLQRAYENQQEYIKQQEKFIERFKAKASKAAQAQSIVKRLDRLDKLEEVEIERPNIKINFKVDTVPGKIICTLKNASKKFGENTILNNTTIEIDRGDKIALIGANGKGKSTLLRMVADVEPFEGERIGGHNVVESFYAQHQLESLRLDDDILEELKHCGSGKTEQELRALLGCFLFSGDDVSKKIKVLSGGEKARVALAKTIASKANFLLLDEPTNHLDMHSVELLAEALNQYQGSFILVSHDRYFISKAANKIWEIVNHEIKEFKGGYTEYLEWNKRLEQQAKKENDLQKKETVVATKVTTDNQPKEISKPLPNKEGINKEAKKNLQKIQKEFATIEEQLNVLKLKKTNLETQLSNPDAYKQPNFSNVEKEYASNSAEINSLEKKYESLFNEIMMLEEELSN
jgi:ATP-binding cassette, subfamily F, member 3